MNTHWLTHRTLSLAFIFCLGTPQPALALRAPAPQEAGTEELLRAGMEESFLENQIREDLESLRVRAEHRLGVQVDAGWHKSELPKDKVIALANTVLNHPDPLLVKKKVRGLMRQLDRRILAPLLNADPGRLSPDLQELREMAIVLPVADDWLVRAYSAVTQGQELYEKRARALAVYSRRAAAEAWGRNGPHLRADFVPFDQDDVKTAPILLRGFLPRMQKWLVRIRQLRKEDRADQELERKAGEYAGALFNGLIIPGEDKSWQPFRDYRGYFRGWMAESNGRLRPAIRLAAELFPDRFSSDPRKMPSFVRFANRPFAHQEIDSIREFNRSIQGPPLTLWQLTTGTGATEAYIRYLENRGAEPLSRRVRLVEQIYGHVLEQGGVVSMLAAGAEQGTEPAGSRFHPLGLSEFFHRTWRPGTDLEEYYKRFFRHWHRRVVIGEDPGGLFLVLWRELVPSEKQGPERQMVRHLPFLEVVIHEIAVALKVNAAEVLIPTRWERTSLARMYANDEHGIKPGDIWLRRLVSSYTVEDSKRFEQDPKKAFTRALVILGLLARVWDLHDANAEVIPGTDVPLYFDFEEGLNPFYNDMELYVEAFLLNYFHQPERKKIPYPVRLAHLMERVDWKEWRAALRDVKEMDFGVLREEVKGHISGTSYDGALPPEVSSRIDSYFNRLIAHQGTIRLDAKMFWKQVSKQLTAAAAAPPVSEGPDVSGAETARENREPKRLMADLMIVMEAQVQADTQPDTLHLRRQMVILDAALLRFPEVVLLLQALEQSELFHGKTILWGQDDLPILQEDILPKGLRHARDEQEMEALLSELSEHGLSQMTFIGRKGRAREITEVLEKIILRTGRDIELLRPGEPTIAVFLAGFGVSQRLLEELATDPDLSTVLNVQL